MVHFDSTFEYIDGKEILVNGVFDDDNNKLGRIFYKHTGNKSSPWQPEKFEVEPPIILKVDELKDIVAELQDYEQTPEPKNDMVFLCLGVVEYQQEYFEAELKRVFGQRIDNITPWKPSWAKETVYVCIADPAIDSEVRVFVTGFTSGFRSAL